VDGLRVTERSLSPARQAWLVHRRSLNVMPAPASDPAGALEDLARVTWMALASCVVLFVANLRGGLPLVILMFGGVGFGLVGLLIRQRVVNGPRRALPTIDPEHDGRMQLAQADALRREFGPEASRPRAGRRVEVLDARARRGWTAYSEGELVALLVDTPAGVLVLRGPIVRSELDAGENAGARWRIERLPKTKSVLSVTALGGECAVERVELEAGELAGLRALPECTVLSREQLPPLLAGRMFGDLVPYR
jgi:hypothetical protein